MLATIETSDLMYVGVAVASLVILASSLFFFWQRPSKVFLTRERKKATILSVTELSHDTKHFRLSLGGKNTKLGLPVGKHIVIHSANPKSCVSSGLWNGKDDPDKGKVEIDRKYTPITGNETLGYVDVIVKIYRPGVVKMPDGREITWEDGGKGSLFLDSKKPGDEIEINGPVGIHEYLGRGTFKMPGKTVTVKNVGMMAGGAGLTPMLQVVQAALRDCGDTCTFSLLYANKTEGDILCREMLDDLAQQSNGRFKVHYTLDFPPEGWTGKTGFISQDMIKECLPGPGQDTLVLMCGPPPMIQFACKQNLEALGYEKSAMLAF